jgi:hypothetical protein
MLGAAFFIPTVIVPALLITHCLTFWPQRHTEQILWKNSASERQNDCIVWGRSETFLTVE